MTSSAAVHSVVIHCQGILFDMDGVLISSLGSVERSWAKWAKMRGVDIAQVREIAHGRRAIDVLAMLCPDLDSQAELELIEEIEVRDNDGLTALPGVPELLAALPRDRWTVVTSATERLARVRLAAGGIPVPESLVTADQVTAGKPHPQPYLTGAELLGFRPEECVVFEDSSSGAQAGRAAGCTVVATTFSHPINVLDAAHYVVTDLAGVELQSTNEGLVLRLTPAAG
jgi:sugar-phosphatase